MNTTFKNPNLLQPRVFVTTITKFAEPPDVLTRVYGIEQGVSSGYPEKGEVGVMSCCTKFSIELGNRLPFSYK